MDKKTSYCLSLVTALFLGVVAGCSKSDLESKSPTARPPSPEAVRTVARIHWLGKKRLATESNATNFMAIWNLPESAKLEAQTLDKLSTAPWRLFGSAASVSNAPTALLRPLLDDLVQEESYLEVEGATNQPGALVLALHLDAARAALWRTNLPIILKSVFASARVLSAEASDFRLETSDLSFSLSRAGDWTLLSLTRAVTNPLLADFQRRLAAGPVPYASRATNYLIEVEGEPSPLGDLLGWTLPFTANVRSLKLVIFGDGANLRTRGWLDFRNTLSLPLDPWNVPSNMIYQPLIGFTAVRGIQPWVESLDFWQKQQLGAAPSEAFFWAQKSAPWLHFFATRSPDAERQFLALKDYILGTVNPALAPNRTGDFAWLTNEFRVAWKGVPFCSPTVDLLGDVIFGGFSANTASNRIIPVEMLQKLQQEPNLVYYDWEVTGEQVAAWTQMSQLMRMAFGYAQLSIKEPGLPWLNAVGPNLGYSATTVTREGDHRLVFARASVLGLSSIELQLLVDWLESPEFPRGLHTLLAPREFVKDRSRPRP